MSDCNCMICRMNKLSECAEAIEADQDTPHGDFYLMIGTAAATAMARGVDQETFKSLVDAAWTKAASIVTNGMTKQ